MFDTFQRQLQFSILWCNFRSFSALVRKKARLLSTQSNNHFDVIKKASCSLKTQDGGFMMSSDVALDHYLILALKIG